MKNTHAIITKIFILLLIIAMLLPGCTTNSTGQSYNEGTYTAVSQGHNGDVTVDVTFSESKIDKIEVKSESETEGLGKPALTKVSDNIIEAQSLAVDTVTGATDSSDAMINAVADAVTQAGGDTEALKNESDNTVKGEDEEITTDVVVVGGGASGTSAALAAAEKGAKVVVLEKADTPGGAGRYLAEGLLAVESEQQKNAGVDFTVDDAFLFLENYTHYRNNANLARAVLEESASTIDWMSGYGAETKLMENTQKAHVDNPMTYHKYVDKNQAYDNMYEKLKSMGGALYTNTVGKDLLLDDSKNIIGVVAEKADGGTLTVNAQKVILATGGYAGSAEMLEKYLNVTNYSSMAYASNTGDGLKMAQSVDAGEYNINQVTFHAAVMAPNDDQSTGAVSTLLNLPLMWVNREGKRFVDEGIVYDFALWGDVAEAQGGEYYVVIDDATLKAMEKTGSPLTNSFEKTYMVGAGADTTQSSNIVAPIEGLSDAMEASVNAGVAFKGDTIEDLSAAMNVDDENLINAADTYTQAVKSGKDTEFLKNKDYLKYSVSEGPFYAVKAVALLENSGGGIRVNSSLQVLNKEFKVINNLYAVGCDAGGVYGDSYPTLEGLTLCFAFNSGRLAGYSAAQSIK